MKRARSNLDIVDLEDFHSRLDEGLASLGRGEGADGEEFMQRMLCNLESREGQGKLNKPKVAKS